MNSPEPLSLMFMEQKPRAASRVLQEFSPAEVAGFLSAAPTGTVVSVINVMPAWSAARCLMEMPATFSAKILQTLPVAKTEMLSRIIDDASFSAIAAHLPTQMASRLARRRTYPNSTVGAWMDTTAATFHPETTVEQCLQSIKTSRTHSGGVVVVVDALHEFMGIIDIDDLLTSESQKELETLMSSDLRPLSSRETLWEADVNKGWLDYVALPVIDAGGHVLGVLSHAALSSGISTQAVPDSNNQSIIVHLTRALFVAMNGLLHVMAGASGNPSNSAAISSLQSRGDGQHGGARNE